MKKYSLIIRTNVKNPYKENEMKNTLTLKNETQKLLFTQEIVGQLSDGRWENTRPLGHWKPWSDCEVVVGTEVGRNFRVIKDNYNLTESSLLEIIGERMVNMVKIKFAVPQLDDESIREIADTDFESLERYARSEKSHNDFYSRRLAKVHQYKLEIIEAKNNEHLYSMKDLRHDLREIKASMRNL